MSQQPAEEIEMTTQDRQRLDQVLAEIRDTTAAAQPSRSSHDLWPKFVVSAD